MINHLLRETNTQEHNINYTHLRFQTTIPGCYVVGTFHVYEVVSQSTHHSYSVLALTPLVHRMPFSGSGDSASLMKVMRLSLLRSGGVMERPGEAEGVATGVGLRLLRRMDWGVNAENTGPEAAKARAR